MEDEEQGDVVNVDVDNEIARKAKLAAQRKEQRKKKREREATQTEFEKELETRVAAALEAELCRRNLAVPNTPTEKLEYRKLLYDKRNYEKQKLLSLIRQKVAKEMADEQRQQDRAYLGGEEQPSFRQRPRDDTQQDGDEDEKSTDDSYAELEQSILDAQGQTEQRILDAQGRTQQRLLDARAQRQQQQHAHNDTQASPGGLRSSSHASYTSVHSPSTRGSSPGLARAYGSTGRSPMTGASRQRTSPFRGHASSQGRSILPSRDKGPSYSQFQTSLVARAPPEAAGGEDERESKRPRLGTFPSRNEYRPSSTEPTLPEKDYRKPMARSRRHAPGEGDPPAEQVREEQNLGGDNQGRREPAVHRHNNYDDYPSDDYDSDDDDQDNGCYNHDAGFATSFPTSPEYSPTSPEHSPTSPEYSPSSPPRSPPERY